MGSAVRDRGGHVGRMSVSPESSTQLDWTIACQHYVPTPFRKLSIADKIRAELTYAAFTALLEARKNCAPACCTARCPLCGVASSHHVTSMVRITVSHTQEFGA